MMRRCSAAAQQYGMVLHHQMLLRAVLLLPATSQEQKQNLMLGLCLVGVQGIREGSQLLVQAFEQDAENPFVLLLLAHFCVRQGFADKVHTVLPAQLWKQPGLSCKLLTILTPACSTTGSALHPPAPLAVRSSPTADNANSSCEYL